MSHDYRRNQAIALDYACRINRRRRNAVDYGEPQVAYAPRPILPPVSVTPATLHRLPPVLDLSPDAPSKWRQHPYAIMQLDNLASGNYHPPPPSSHCPECKMDAYIEDIRLRYCPHSHPVVPDFEFKGPKPGHPVYVDFHYEGSGNGRGVLVSDILSFNANMIQPHYKLVRQPPGHIKLTLRIDKVGEVEDILYANCAHRHITRFNLAWLLAFSFKRLAIQKFRLPVENLDLMFLYSADGSSNWIALARYIH